MVGKYKEVGYDSDPEIQSNHVHWQAYMYNMMNVLEVLVVQWLKVLEQDWETPLL